MSSNLREVLSGMQSSQWYDHFKGALYPLNLDLCRSKVQEKYHVKSLLQIAADYIVLDSTMTSNAVNILPQELCTVLMQQALEKNKDRAIDVLLSRWPLQTLSLKKFTPNIYTNLAILHDHVELSRVAKQGLRYTTSVAHNFLETLKKKTSTRLKCIDLTGYPTAEVITYYLATHCMLAHNEARQNLMIRKYEEAIQLLPPEEAHSRLERFTTDQSLPDDYFHVKLDVFISSEPALAEVCKALKVSAFEESTLRLVVEKLDVTCMGYQKIHVLLEQVNTEYLLGLRLKYNSIGSAQFTHLTPILCKFTNLVSLDLSCNCINAYQNDLTVDALITVFKYLKCLVRLDLSNNRLKSKLRRILGSIEKPLVFLRLAGCGLTLEDMTYLSLSHHATGLKELDISENGLRGSVGMLLLLLQNVKSQLCVLELEDTFLTDHQFELLGPYIKQLASLLYLNISGNSASSEKLYQFGQCCAILPDLQYICMSYARDVYQSEAEESEMKQQFAFTLADEIIKEQKRLGLKTRVPTIVLSELDQEMG
ncbi:hypothetical protein ACF0H5_002313 [Mactra antiquata]